MKKFEVFKTYSCRSICNHECIWNFEIIRRTKTTVLVRLTTGTEVLRKKLYFDDKGNEMIYPLGQYSMAPILRAESEVK